MTPGPPSLRALADSVTRIADHVAIGNRQVATYATAQSNVDRLRKAVHDLRQLVPVVTEAAEAELTIGAPEQLFRTLVPDPPDDPLAWVTGTDPIDLREGLAALARELSEAVQTAWRGEVSPERFQTPDPDTLVALGGLATTPELEEVVAQLHELRVDYEQLRGRTLPGAGDVHEAERIRAGMAAAWEALAAAGISKQRVDCLRRLNGRGVPLTELGADELAWLHESGVAGSLMVRSRYG